MNQYKSISKPIFIRIFAVNFIRVFLVVAILATIGLFVIKGYYSSNVREMPIDEYTELQYQAVKGAQYYTRYGRLDISKRAELRREVLDVWEEYNLAVRIIVGKDDPITATRCAMLKCYLNNNEYNLFLDDFDYSLKFSRNLNQLTEYSNDDRYSILVNDVYVNWDDYSFYPGHVSVVNSFDNSWVATYDFTPEGASRLNAYVHFYTYQLSGTWNPMSMVIIGDDIASSVSYDAEEVLIYQNSFSEQVPLLIQSHVVNYEDEFNSILIDSLVLIVIICILVALVVALIISLYRYYHEKAIYEIFDYRRKTTDAMAHDLKTPLAISSLYLEKLQERETLEEQAEYFKEVESSIVYMNKLINNILEFSNSQYTDMRVFKENFDAYEETMSIVSGLLPAANKRGIDIKVEGKVILNLDKKLWHQAIENLLVNACKYASSNSVITVTLSESKVSISNSIESSIENAELLKEPFVKGAKVRGENSGSGLGLSVADINMKRMGYKLSVEGINKKFVVTMKKLGKSKAKLLAGLMALLVMCNLLSLIVIAKTYDSKYYYINELSDSRYEFRVQNISNSDFVEFIDEIPDDISGYGDIQLKARVELRRNESDTLDSLVVVSFYPNMYSMRSVVNHEGDNPHKMLDGFVVFDPNAYVQMNPHVIAVYMGENSDFDPVYINGLLYKVDGTVTIYDDYADTEYISDCYVNLNTFYNMTNGATDIVIQYPDRLTKHQENQLIDYISNRFNVLETLKPTRDFDQALTVKDYVITALIVILLLVVDILAVFKYIKNVSEDNFLSFGEAVKVLKEIPLSILCSVILSELLLVFLNKVFRNMFLNKMFLMYFVSTFLGLSLVLILSFVMCLFLYLKIQKK